MHKVILVFLLIGCRVGAQAPEEKRDTMFLAFNPRVYKTITLNKTEIKGKIQFRYEWSGDRPINAIELIAAKKRSKVKINKDKIWEPREEYGILWFAEDLHNTNVIYIVETVNNRQIVRRILKVNEHIIYL